MGCTGNRRPPDLRKLLINPMALKNAVNISKEQMKEPHYLMQFFAYEHLPDFLQVASKPFGELAEKMEKELPSNPETTTALRKLLEAKDCAVRALLFK